MKKEERIMLSLTKVLMKLTRMGSRRAAGDHCLPSEANSYPLCIRQPFF